MWSAWRESLHLRELSVNPLDDKLRNSQRRVLPFAAARPLISQNQNVGFTLKNSSHGFIAQVPECGNLGNRIVTHSETGNLRFWRWCSEFAGCDHFI